MAEDNNPIELTAYQLRVVDEYLKCGNRGKTLRTAVLV